MGISSMHIQGASAGSILHNARENFSHSVVFTDEKNELYNTAKEAYEIYRQELAIRSEAYSARTKQKLQKKSITKLSAIFNLEKHHTLEDLQSLKKYLEKELDTKVYQIAIHRDEGKLVEKTTKKELYSGKEFFKNPADDTLYFDKKYTKKIDMKKYDIEKNYHAHIEMLGIDSTGQAIKRNRLSKYQLSKMQTKVAELLHMKRGVLGSKAKRRDTHQFKERGSEQQEMKLTVSSLKADIERLRKEMAEAKQFSRADYQALAQIKKRTKKATLSEAVDQFLIFKRRIELEKEALELEARKKDLTIKALEKQLSEKPKEKIVEVPKVEYVENPVNRALQKELSEKKEELKEKEEFLSVAIEAQEKFRSYAQTYQKQLSIAQNELKEQKIENVSLKAENSSLRAIVSEISSYLKCKKDDIVEKVKNLFSKDETDDEWEKMLKNPKMQVSEKTVEEKT